MKARPSSSQAGKASHRQWPAEERMRVGCGSATIGMFAKQWFGKVDEVVVVDDHITGVLSEHQAGKLLGVRETGIDMKGRRSTPGRYFQVARARHLAGAAQTFPIRSPSSLLLSPNSRGRSLAPAHGQHYRRAFCLLRARRRLDGRLKRNCRRSCTNPSQRIRENCEPALYHCPVHGRSGWLASRRSHGESRQADATPWQSPHARHLRRCSRLCLAWRRHHLYGGCFAHAAKCFRLCSHTGAGCADRIHAEIIGLCRARRTYGLREAPGSHPAGKRTPAVNSLPSRKIRGHSAARRK